MENGRNVGFAGVTGDFMAENNNNLHEGEGYPIAGWKTCILCKSVAEVCVWIGFCYNYK